MAKRVCAICGKPFGMFDNRTIIYDGLVCEDCLFASGISTLKDPLTYHTEDLKKLLKERKEMAAAFTATKTHSRYMAVDETHRLFKAGQDLFAYGNLVSFAWIEDGIVLEAGGRELESKQTGEEEQVDENERKDGTTGEGEEKRLQKDACSSMSIRLSLENTFTDYAEIKLVTYKVRTKDMIYRSARSYGQACVEDLRAILL